MTLDVMLCVPLFANHPNAIPVAKNQKLPFATSNANGKILDFPTIFHNQSHNTLNNLILKFKFYPSYIPIIFKSPDCTPMCPDKACEMTDCPKCVNVCKTPHCVTHCQSPKPECESVCAEPNCDWKCSKPLCPKPKCELVCENPTCRP